MNENKKTNKIKSEKLVAKFGNAMLDYGFTTIPNTILFYKNRLEITAKELHLIIMVLALNGRGLYEINDKHLHPDGKSFIRQRKSLEKKGLLKCEISKGIRDGSFTTLGIVYDFNGLRKKVEELVDYDNTVLESDAVEKIEDEPPLPEFQEFEQKPIDIPKPKHNDDDDFFVGSSSSLHLTNEQENFIKSFEALHFECLGKKINLAYRKKYREYLLAGFEKSNCDFTVALDNAKKMFRNKSPSEHTSLKLQDCVLNAFLKKDKQLVYDDKIPKTKNKIVHGLDVASQLLERIASGVVVEEAYRYAKNNC